VQDENCHIILVNNGSSYLCPLLKRRRGQARGTKDNKEKKYTLCWRVVIVPYAKRDA
jgi:hypothetical protein